MAELATIHSLEYEPHLASHLPDWQLLSGSVELATDALHAWPHLQLVTPEFVDAHVLFGNTTQVSGWRSADSFPTLRAVRQQTDKESYQLLEQRKQQLREGDFGAVPYAFNPLTTATKLHKAEAAYGKDHEQYRSLYTGFHLDTQRHLSEARRRLTYEYFAPVAQQFDPVADSYVYGGYKLKEVVNNGLSPVGAEAVGVENLVANRREEYTSTAIGRLGQLMLEHAGVQMPNRQPTQLVISEIDTSPQTMIWAVRFDPQNRQRYQEQVGFPKTHITHEVIVEALKRKGLIEANAQPTQTDVLGLQAISLEGEGVLDVMPLLDEIASEYSGQNIFMGEVVPAGAIKDYTAIPAQAAERQARNPEEVAALEAEILRLAADETDGWLANRLIDDFVTNMLLDKASANPAMARQIFGEHTAQLVEESMRQRLLGNTAAADEVLITARAEAPPATVCTGGECDLEIVNRNTLEGQKIAEAVHAAPGDTVVADKERSCPNCHRKKLVYAYNDKKVNTKCFGCGAFVSKVSKVPASSGASKKE